MNNTRLQEEDRDFILTHFREQYEANCELCGEDSEEAAEAKTLYKKILSKPLKECETDIFNFYDEMNDAVNGDIEGCYKGEHSLVTMIKKLILNSKNTSDEFQTKP